MAATVALRQQLFLIDPSVVPCSRTLPGACKGAQTFLDELAACYGTDLFAEGVKFEDSSAPGGFMDMYWRDRATIEMKAPGQTHRLASHRELVFRYWREIGARRPP